MARIVKIIRWERKDEDKAVVYVQLEDGEEYQVWVGGEVETFFHRGQLRAHVKKFNQRQLD